jgi:hypothetical protein
MSGIYVIFFIIQQGKILQPLFYISHGGIKSQNFLEGGLNCRDLPGRLFGSFFTIPYCSTYYHLRFVLQIVMGVYVP